MSEKNATTQEESSLFSSLKLAGPLEKAITSMGFERCTPIQSKILPWTLDGYDAIGKAQTGTGKTAAFLITIINDLLVNVVETERFVGEPRALILAPTRELAMQIEQDSIVLNKYSGLNTLLLIGGMDYEKQRQQLNSQLVDILVATPGRLNDYVSRAEIILDQVNILVIDEADRMLDMGFIPQVKRIIQRTPQKSCRQTLLFSATFTDDVLRLSEQWTVEPIKVEIEPDSVASSQIEQKTYLVEGDKKMSVLSAILSEDGVERTIVFANRRDQTRDICEQLKRKGFQCGILSGEINQNRRIKTLENFRSGKISVLVATDVVGRGIHVDDVSHVINYNLPEDPEDYVHRIGRTGRAGATGVSINLVCEDEGFFLPAIEQLLGEKLKCTFPPENYSL